MDQTEYQGFLNFMVGMADKADQISMHYFREQQLLEVSVKEDGSFVTKADQEIERKLRTMIDETYDAHNILGEEQGETISDVGGYRWIIDPIDGTHGFMTGLPIWATLIALEHKGKILVCMISAPALCSRWWAGDRFGAYKYSHGETMKISVSTIYTLDKSQLVYTGVIPCGDRWHLFPKLLTKVWRERGVGDFWGHCLVAEGAAEIMLDPIVNVWDVAALHLLVVESGGAMTDDVGESSYTAGYAITTNKRVHAPLLDFIRDN